MAYQYLDLLPIITEIDFNDQAQIRNLLLRVRKNFDELQAVVTILQAYENNTGVPINEDVNENKPIWDRSGSINEDGTFPTEKLTEKLVGLQNELQLADEAVTEAKIAVGAIKTPHLDDGCITDTKLAAGAITENKLNWQSHLLY